MIKKSVLGLFDNYLILKKNSKNIIGFVTIKENNDYTASIGLIGVNKLYQGHGYGSVLVKKFILSFIYAQN